MKNSMNKDQLKDLLEGAWLTVLSLRENSETLNSEIEAYKKEKEKEAGIFDKVSKKLKGK